MSDRIKQAFELLTKRLDHSPTLLMVDDNTISIINEVFNWMQTAVIIDTCNQLGLSITITVNGKRIHDSIELTIVTSPLLLQKDKNTQTAFGLFF